jgi:hypothetical protein
MLRSQETSQEASLQKLGQARKFEGWILSSAMARKTIDYSNFESGRSVHFLRASKLVDKIGSFGLLATRGLPTKRR